MSKKIFLLFSIFIFLFVAHKVMSLDCDQISDTSQRVTCLENKIADLGHTANTLNSEISYMNSQISLTTSKIQQTEDKINSTEKEINSLGSRIEGLDTSLNFLSKSLLSRVAEGYKQRSVSLFNLIFDSINASDLIDRIKYMQTAQNNNQKILVQVQETKLNFEEQKKLREEKIKQLDDLRATLANQKNALENQQIAKKNLLTATNNDEKTYQRLLSQARAEYAAIQGIIAGVGTETKLREVKKGEIIASVISGASCNSSGGHLHFIVQQNNTVVNPFDYLKSINYKNCSGSSCDSGDGDPFNPSGNLDWPLNPTIELSQGYGSTWAVRNTWVGRIYSFHNGIDINSSSNNVIAIADGTLNRGSYALGCTLSYTKLVHKDSNISTLYLHTYTQ
ncbi:MAG: hypothetical protein Q7R95_07045 [bacterium]|nr:hypothetical protein [bacterium]